MFCLSKISSAILVLFCLFNSGCELVSEPSNGNAETPTANEGLEVIAFMALRDADRNIVANIITLQCPMPKEFSWTKFEIFEARGSQTEFEKWLGGSTTASIGDREFKSVGNKAVTLDKNGKRIPYFEEGKSTNLKYTHLRTSFIVPTELDLTKNQVRIDIHSTIFELETLEDVETQFRARYDIHSNNLKRKADGFHQICLQINCQTQVEKVKVGNFISEVHSNGGHFVFFGEISSRASPDEKSLLLKFKNIDAWIPFRYEHPFVN